LIAQSYGSTYGIPVTVARCGNIYGGGDLNWSRIIPGSIRDLITEKRPILRSDGTFVRDYVHVDDIVSAYLKLSEVSQTKDIKGEAFNFSCNKPLTVLNLYKSISIAAVGKFIDPEIQNTAKSEIKDQHLNSSKAKLILDWESKVTLEDGLKKTVSWYKAYLAGK
jgi:CDP-glucose 4,6-dehydratase